MATDDGPPSLPPSRPPAPPPARTAVRAGFVTSGHDRSVFFAGAVALLLVVLLVGLIVIVAGEAGRADLGPRLGRFIEDLRPAQSAPQSSAPAPTSPLTPTPTSTASAVETSAPAASSPVPTEAATTATAPSVAATSIIVPTATGNGPNRRDLDSFPATEVAALVPGYLPSNAALGASWNMKDYDGLIPTEFLTTTRGAIAPCLSAMDAATTTAAVGRVYRYYQDGVMGWGCALIVHGPFLPGAWTPSADPGGGFTPLGAVVPASVGTRLVNVDWEPVEVTFADGMLTGRRTGTGILTRGEGLLRAEMTYWDVGTVRGVMMFATLSPGGGPELPPPSSAELARSTRDKLRLVLGEILGAR